MFSLLFFRLIGQSPPTLHLDTKKASKKILFPTLLTSFLGDVILVSSKKTEVQK